MIKRFTVMTYNVHSCVGNDGLFSPQRIAAVILQHNPDIIALQELDRNLSRTGRMDQAHIIAELLKMDFHFHASLQIEGGFYGNAILSRFPMRLQKAGELPTIKRRRTLEPRGAVWAELYMEDLKIQVINTHLGLNQRERFAQAAALLGPEWIGHFECRPPIILCGDFNSLPGYSAHRCIKELLYDAQSICRGSRIAKTWPSSYPLISLDYIFVTPDVFVRETTAPRNPLTRTASDHLPLLAELLVS